MKLRGIFCFELSFQTRRVWTWLCLAATVAITYQLTTEAFIGGARRDGYFLNSPFLIATVTLFGSMIGLLLTAPLAGDAAARDVQTRMHPLVYTTPLGKGTWLTGRFLAAFALNGMILLAVPAGLLLAALWPRAEAALIGPFRPDAYLGAYAALALSNAFVATAILFSMAALSRRAMASYLGGLFLFVLSILCWQFVARHLGWWGAAKLMDPFGLTVMAELSRVWTPVQKNTLLIGAQGPLVVNRVLWLGIALGVLAFTYFRVRFAHHAAGGWRSRGARPLEADFHPIAIPRIPRTFGFMVHARQTLAIAWESFREIAFSWGGRALAGLAVILVLTVPNVMDHLGVPLRPTTAHITPFLSAPLANPGEIIWMIVPLLIVYYAGELVWREREARLSEMADTAPVPDWVPLLGKFLGLCMVLTAVQGLMVAAGVLIQVLLGWHDFEIGLYGRILFGLRLVDYILFVVLALVVHVLVNQKYAGHVVLLVAYGVMAFGSELGLERRLLIYGSDPGWSYSDMRGFGPVLGPWLWFKLYWAGWALLLAVAAKLLWVRGSMSGLPARLVDARRRATAVTIRTAVAAAAIILTTGGFISWNTKSTSDSADKRAAYERHYGLYRDIAQPRLTGIRLQVEIHPHRNAAEIRGTFDLVNRSAVAIDAIHVATATDVETSSVSFDRPVSTVLVDEDLDHRMYTLKSPLQPGDTLRLDFEVRLSSSGHVVANGTFFTARDCLPSVGYQRNREIQNAGDRRAHGLAPRPEVRSLDDTEALQDVAGEERVAFEAVVSTDKGQVALAPGRLIRSWAQDGRTSFHYVTDAPVRNDYAFFSARYAVREARWSDVDIQILHHPDHPWNADRMIRSVQASLDHYTRQFGPYPHHQIRLIEHPGDAIALHAFPVNISYQEGFSLFDPESDPRDLDFPFAVVAHEVAHQWWGNQLTPAPVEGSPLLTESLAWYSAMGVVEKTYGPQHLQRLLSVMHEAYLSPRSRAGAPLLTAYDRFLAYRKGPFAMYALREYVGAEPVDGALRRLLEKHRSGEPPLPTSLDLYRELQAVTPDTLHSLLADLFETNTFWELAAEHVTAEQTDAGLWQVTLDVQGRKVIVDTAGAETEVPMDDLVEVGVFGGGKDGSPGKTLDLSMHRVRSGRQRITVTVPEKPARGGIDPRHLLIDVDPGDNLADVR